ncbi:MAG: helix-turn-helix domain-containing protein [Acidiferrobacterales bacterium]|nr:helix-turn-helix domain-containing protein [Acidiferrobacterales bacterium]
MTQTIAILGMDGCSAGVMMGGADLFTIANILYKQISGKEEDYFDVVLVSPNGKSICCSNSYVVSVDGDIHSIPSNSVVICQPFSMTTKLKFVEALEMWRPLAAWLSNNISEFRLLVATGTGVFLPAEAGLLDGKKASTAWWFDALFRERYPNIRIDKKVGCVKEGKVWCSGAPSSWQDTHLSIVSEFQGERFAKTISRYMMTNFENRTQAPLSFISQIQTTDAVVNRADFWIQKNLGTTIRLEDIAKFISVSERTLIRHFERSIGRSPLTYIQESRVERCKLLLEVSDLTFSEISNQCGYKDDSSFRKMFKKLVSMTPSQYRKMSRE